MIFQLEFHERYPMIMRCDNQDSTIIGVSLDSTCDGLFTIEMFSL